MVGWMISMYQQLEDSNNDNKSQDFTVKKALYVLGISAFIILFAYGNTFLFFLNSWNLFRLFSVIIRSIFKTYFTAQHLSYAHTLFLILPVFCWMPVKTLNMFRQFTKIETLAWIGGIEILVRILFTNRNKPNSEANDWQNQKNSQFISQVLSFFHRIFLSGLLIALLAYEYIILKGTYLGFDPT